MNTKPGKDSTDKNVKLNLMKLISIQNGDVSNRDYGLNTLTAFESRKFIITEVDFKRAAQPIETGIYLHYI